MKRIAILTGIVTVIMLGVFKTGYAYSSLGSGHFMRIEGRDASNRIVESEVLIEETAFSRAYSRLTPFNTISWRRSPISTSFHIINEKMFKVSLVAVPFLYSEVKSFFHHIKRLLSKGGTFLSINVLLILMLTVLVFESPPQRLDEPRFRIPVLIE